MQSCIICLEEGVNLKQLNHCGIYYVHKKCHKEWKSKNNTCIVCREPLTQLDIIVVQPVQPVQEEQQIFQEIVQQSNNHRFINTLKFKVIYTIIVIIVTLLGAFIFFIW